MFCSWEFPISHNRFPLGQRHGFLRCFAEAIIMRRDLSKDATCVNHLPVIKFNL
jgi:hypothetical protein